jgi:hypothetical protein
MKKWHEENASRLQQVGPHYLQIPYLTDLIGFSRRGTDCHYDRFGQHRRTRHRLLRRYPLQKMNPPLILFLSTDFFLQQWFFSHIPEYNISNGNFHESIPNLPPSLLSPKTIWDRKRPFVYISYWGYIKFLISKKLNLKIAGKYSNLFIKIHYSPYFLFKLIWIS